ncbi:hypothetical protein OG21DRAFT_1490949 [Imleria badia]|nr:hypothetical protein OG21DRAFT_1490949 [Imleria badia]
MLQEFIVELHKQWKCDAHTKDPGNPTYCYNPHGTNMCYQLSHNSISFWAVQIGKGRATADKKPPTVATQMQGHAHETLTGPGPTPYPYAAALSPYYFMPPWPAPVQGPHGGNGTVHPSYLQPPMTILSPVAQAYPSPQPSIPRPLSTSSQQSHGALLSSDTTSLPNPLGSAAPIPDVIPWFGHLEKHEKSLPGGAKFSDFGFVLEGKGFFRISQLTREYIPINLLQQWLGIEYGTAVLIFQFVEAEMKAINAGQSILPRDL